MSEKTSDERLKTISETALSYSIRRREGGTLPVSAHHFRLGNRSKT